MARTKKKSASKALTLEQFTVGGNLNVSDVLTVVTSKAEQRYSGEIERCKAEIEVVKADQEAAKEKIHKQALKEAKEPHKDKVKALNDALKPLGGTATLDYAKSNWQLLNVNDDGELLTKITVKQKGERHSHTTFQLTTKKSKDLEKLLAEHEAAGKRIEELKAEAIGWKRKLNNVPMLERQYKAKIATAKLATSDDGQALLEMLESGLEDAILTLPSA